jgi:ABC-type lipoprotein export system ATPase subunit
MLIDIRGLEKAYLVGEQPFLALSGVDLTIDSGELVFVVGKSGSG